MIFFPRHFGGVMDRLATDATDVIYSMGNFNSDMNSNEDIKSGNKRNIRDVGAPNQFVDNIDAHDVWRLQNEEARDLRWDQDPAR